MKKSFILSALLVVAIAAMAQQPVISFETREHNFGKIHEEDGRVTTIFEFKNEGMAPLVLSNVRASCGCTTPKWTREPVEPGQTGQITVTYNPNGRPGGFTKTITVTSNASEPTTKLTIRGEVIPRQAKPVNRYNVKMGDLSLKNNTLSYGLIYKGKEAVQQIEYANLTDHDITIEVLVNENGQYLAPDATPKTLRPNETGTLNVILQSAYCPIWGPVDTEIYMKVNGQKIISDEYKITVNADIQEDFTLLTAQQLQQAPIVETAAKQIDLGTIKAGQRVLAKYTIKNVGSSQLLIRRILASEGLKVTADKTAVKGGKSTNLKVDLKAVNPDGTPMQASSYKRQISIITNDPKNSVIRVDVVWTVEE